MNGRARSARAGALTLGHLRICSAVVFTTLLIAGCASPPSANDTFTLESNEWIGRLSLKVDSEPPQAFSAGFRLQGNAEQGELALNSPLGNVLAVMQWQPEQAVLRQGDSKRQYASLDDMASSVTGDTALPVRALFAWLKGQQPTTPGWNADVSRISEGRLIARRLMPLPTAELRVVLDRP